MRLLVCGLFTVALASPQVSFPFNAQVPPVARASNPFRFQFAAATFSESLNIAYQLVDGPTWLQLDGRRTLSGTPSINDIGTATFGIRASDSVGSTVLNCTLITTEDVGPRVLQEASDQLAKFGRLTSPGTLSIYPGDAFTLQLGPQTFQVGPSPTVAYYAVLQDRTPLPAWIGFNPTSLSFFGVAPMVGDVSQVYTISVIASDVIGFSGAETAFSLRISRRQLIFIPQREEYVVNGEAKINLANQIFLNDDLVSLSQIVASNVSGPSWLSLDSSSLTLSGEVPADFDYQQATVIVQDSSGSFAQKTLLLAREGLNATDSPKEGTIFPSVRISNITTRAGDEINFPLPRELVDRPGFSTIVTFDVAQTWLVYDDAAGRLRGTVPNLAPQSSIQVNVTLSTPLRGSAVESFFVNIAPSKEDTPGTSTPSGPGVAGQDATSDDGPRRYRLSGRQVAGIAVGILAAVVLAAILITIWCQRRRKGRSSIDKGDISRPMIETENAWQHANLTETSISSVPPTSPRPGNNPPQIHLEVSASPIKSPVRTSRISTNSSLGDGAHAVFSDTNIPIWGSQDGHHGLHDSYSAAARLSTTMGDKSNTTKRTTFGYLPNRHSRSSLAFPGPLNSQQGSLLPNLSSSNIDILSTTTTTNTSISRPSSVLIRPLSRFAVENRRSVRLVAPSGHGPSRTSTSTTLNDRRSIAERRQSFVRNRASSGQPSIMFSTASRNQRSAGAEGLQSPYGKRGKRFSESSSLEPPVRNPRRLQDGEIKVLSVERPGDDKGEDEGESCWYTSEEEDEEEEEFRRQMALPRHQRQFVLPGEASPTPPPSLGKGTFGSEWKGERWKKQQMRLGRDSRGELLSSSPLARGAELEIIEPRRVREPLGLTNYNLGSGGQRAEVPGKWKSVGRVMGRGEEKATGGDEVVVKRVRDRDVREGSGPAFI
ncbi:Axial budding pattern protein 2 [Sphaceloma murrayae]|uniref:Axial budding pattern protein 2 n=1 Tax=Sphaceloma murrayae TaxID=2082308 RepID=A0A2K1QWY1_9PEZI|nr:Axial budding pattern protein 2 [Sphaceloma murrayae]